MGATGSKQSNDSKPDFGSSINLVKLVNDGVLKLDVTKFSELINLINAEHDLLVKLVKFFKERTENTSCSVNLCPHIQEVETFNNKFYLFTSDSKYQLTSVGYDNLNKIFCEQNAWEQLLQVTFMRKYNEEIKTVIEDFTVRYNNFDAEHEADLKEITIATYENVEQAVLRLTESAERNLKSTLDDYLSRYSSNVSGIKEAAKYSIKDNKGIVKADVEDQIAKLYANSLQHIQQLKDKAKTELDLRVNAKRSERQERIDDAVREFKSGFFCQLFINTVNELHKEMGRAFVLIGETIYEVHPPPELVALWGFGCAMILADSKRN